MKKMQLCLSHPYHDIWLRLMHFMYCNPVRNMSILNLDCRKLEQGAYVVSIINMAGEVLQTEDVQVQTNQKLVKLPLKNVPAGSYLIHVFNRKTAASYAESMEVR